MQNLAHANHTFSETDRFEYLKKVQETIQRLEDLGITVKPGSRLHIYEREFCLAACLNEERSTQAGLSIQHYIQGMQEIDELHYIVRMLGGRSDSRKKLRYLASGHDLLRNDTNTEARDIRWTPFFGPLEAL